MVAANSTDVNLEPIAVLRDNHVSLLSDLSTSNYNESNETVLAAHQVDTQNANNLENHDHRHL